MPIVLADLENPVHQEAIVALLDMYSRDEFGDGRSLAEDIKARLVTGLRRHGGARVFLAYEDERAVGVAVSFLGFSTFKAQPLLNIHDIAVSPACRGKGIGTALLKAVEDEARRLGCCKVTLEVRSDNLRAQRVYRQAEFKGTEPETWFWSRQLP